MEAPWDVLGQMVNWQKRQKPDRKVENSRYGERSQKGWLKFNWDSVRCPWSNGESGSNGENLTGKVKMADMAKDLKKVDGNFIEARWDDPGKMANWRKPVSNGEIYESGKKNQQKVDGILTEGPRDISGKMTNVTKVASQVKEAKTWPQGWKWQICLN